MAESTTPEAQDVLRQLFDQLDTNHTGRIDENAIISLFAQQGLNEDQSKKFAREFGRRSSGSDLSSISFEAFAEGMSSLGFGAGSSGQEAASVSASHMSEDDAHRMFDQLDQDGNDVIDRMELAVGLTRSGSRHPFRHAIDVIRAVAGESASTISRDQFLQAVESGILAEVLATEPQADLDDEDLNQGTTVLGDALLQASGGDAIGGAHTVTSSAAVLPADLADPALQHIPQAKLERLKKYFVTADYDESGYIGLSELCVLLQDSSLLGQHCIDTDVSEDHVKRVMNILDDSGDNQLDFPEFCVAFEDLFTHDGKFRSKNKSFLIARSCALYDENRMLRDRLDVVLTTLEELRLESDRRDQERLKMLHDQGEQDEEELAKLENQNRQLLNTVDQLKRQNKELEHDLHVLQEQLDQSRRSSVTASQAAPVDDDEEDESDVAMLRKRNRQLVRMLEEVHNQYRLRFDAYEEQLAQLSELIETLGGYMEVSDDVTEAREFLDQSNMDIEAAIAKTLDLDLESAQIQQLQQQPSVVVGSAPSGAFKVVQSETKVVSSSSSEHLEAFEKQRSMYEETIDRLTKQLQEAQDHLDKQKMAAGRAASAAWQTTAHQARSQNNFGREMSDLRQELADAEEAAERARERYKKKIKGLEDQHRENMATFERDTDERLALKDKEIKRLETEFQQTRHKLEDEIRRLSAQVEENEEAMSSVTLYEERIETLSQEMSRLESELRSVNATLEQVRAEKLALERSLSEEQDRVRGQHEVELKQQAAAGDVLKQQHEALLAGLRSQVGALQSDKKSLEKNVAELNEQLTAARLEADTAKNRSRDTDAQRIAAMEKEIGTLKDELRSSTADCDRAKQAERSKETELQEAKQRLAASENTCVELKDQCKRAQDEAQRLQAELQSVRLDKDRIHADMTSTTTIFNERIASLEREIREKTATISTLERELERARDTRPQEDRIAALEKELADVQRTRVEAINSFEQRLAEHREELDKSQRDRQGLLVEIAQLHEKLSAKAREIDELHANLAEAQQASRQQLSASSLTIKQLRESLAEAKSQSMDANSTVQDLEARLLRQQRDAIMGEMDSSKTLTATLEAKLTALQHDLEVAYSNRTRLERQIAKLQAENAHIKSQLEVYVKQNSVLEVETRNRYSNEEDEQLVQLRKRMAMLEEALAALREDRDILVRELSDQIEIERETNAELRRIIERMSADRRLVAERSSTAIVTSKRRTYDTMLRRLPPYVREFTSTQDRQQTFQRFGVAGSKPSQVHTFRAPMRASVAEASVASRYSSSSSERSVRMTRNVGAVENHS